MANLTAVNLDIDEIKKESGEFIAPDIFVTGHTRHLLENVIDLGFSSIITYIGIVSNILVLVVFHRQGFNDSTSVSMSAIAVWDLVKCFSGAIQRLYAPIGLVSRPQSVSWGNISTATLTYLITFSSYVSAAMAAYVAVERCLCVVIPFKVKFLLTPKTSLKCMLALSAIVFGSFFPIFFIYDIVWIYSPKYNATVAIYSYSNFFKEHNGPLMRYYNLIGIIYPTMSFFVIVISTAIIVSRLKESSQFRAESANVSKTSTSGTEISSRDKQVMKMLLVIIAVYVIALFPRIVLYMAKYYVPEFYFLRKYHNIFLVVCYVVLILDFGNATVNFYIFLAMSSNFRSTFFSMFRHKKEKQCQIKSNFDN